MGILNLLSQIRNFKWQKQQQRDQYEQASHQLDLLNSAQLTERFSRAVEQLGSTTPAIRIGGIFALERVARDSLVDHANISATFAAFVRDCLPTTNFHESSYVLVLPSRAPDAHAALAVLSVLLSAQRKKGRID